RIDYIMQDSKASYLISEADIECFSKNENSANPNIILPSNSLCYCIYTSGTTGQPKGVLISHSCVLNFVQKNHVNSFQKTLIDNCSTIICCNSVSFDIVLQEIFLPLLNGVTVAMLPDAQMYSDEPNLMLDDGLGLIITPTKLKLYMGNEKFLYQILKQTSVIMCGAEPFTENLLSQIRKYTDATVFNGYGPTETTCGVLYSHITDANDITIGKPIANTQIYIVDRYMQPVPIGVVGELCIVGDGVGAGYLNRPELTAEKFIYNPFGNGKLYKTGDLAYWREDGNIVYVGRNDFQVKIRGLRIELGEIENALQGVQGILQAVVTVRKDEAGRQLICAFYTGQETDGKILRAAIGQKLPKYMLPHCFTHLDELPLTSSGKVNRKALPKVDLSQIATAEEYIGPVGEIEKHLAALMEQVLGYSPIGRDDDFFDLGGDSLKAIEFVSKAHSEGIYFAVQSIFDHPTVRQLTEYIQTGNKQTVLYSETDFTEISKILEKNKLEYISTPPKTEVGNILLAGATGFLGIHILANYLDYDTGTAYCLVRGKNQADSEKRLTELLKFYFGDKYCVGRRIQVVNGDLQKERFGLTEQEYQILRERVDTVINAAASVKHYGSYRYFHETNVESVSKLITFCKGGHAKLVHVSTLSVSGNGFDTFEGYVSEIEKHFYESDLYIDQPLENVYARSKFEAEKLILEEMTNGFYANIMRMGNLTNRFSDGMFQINYQTNAAAQRIKGILELGMVPDYLIAEEMDVEFTPIDEAAQAIMTIARHFSTKRTVFHINNTKAVYLDRLIEIFCELGCPLKAVSGADFTAALRKTAKQAGLEHIFETFINDLDKNDRLNYDSNIRIENAFTEEYLRRLGFKWSEIGIEYLRKYVSYFRKIGYLGV
ncbi:MAG: thioester reductase domain-containing protein, partial [Oscillospiraceae bacterium]|nr:thioester reductase domain-containing protein [Oscillospiraceae bacterium]